MRIDTKTEKRLKPQTFSGTVEVAITGINTEKGRMVGQGWRRSFRVHETTVDEVFAVVLDAVKQETEK